MEKKRLFRCSNEKGYFVVSEKYADFGQVHVTVWVGQGVCCTIQLYSAMG